MIINLYSIKDLLNGYAAPVVMPNHESAKRWFQDMATENPTIGNNKEDFTVHFIGHLDTETGEITPSDKMYLLHDLRTIPQEEENV